MSKYCALLIALIAPIAAHAAGDDNTSPPDYRRAADPGLSSAADRGGYTGSSADYAAKRPSPTALNRRMGSYFSIAAALHSGPRPGIVRLALRRAPQWLCRPKGGSVASP